MKKSQYPYINAWIQDGSIELGGDGFSHSTARAMDKGGVVWESEDDFDTLEEAPSALEQGIDLNV